MAYRPIEIAVQTLLQGLGIFSPTDVTRGDFRVLDKGSAPYAVLTPGPFRSEPVGGFQTRRGQVAATVTWDLDIWIFERYTDDGTAWDNFERTRDTVMDKLQGASLGLLPGIGKVIIQAGNEPSELNDEDDNGPFFIHQTLRCTIEEFAR